MRGTAENKASASLLARFLSFWSLKLHSPRGDVEHGWVESLASEGRAFSIPPLLQHLMDFLQTENREIKGDHKGLHASSQSRWIAGTELLPQGSGTRPTRPTGWKIIYPPAAQDQGRHWVTANSSVRLGSPRTKFLTLSSVLNKAMAALHGSRLLSLSTRISVQIPNSLQSPKPHKAFSRTSFPKEKCSCH